MKEYFLTLNNPTADELYRFFDVVNHRGEELYDQFVGGLEGEWQFDDPNRTRHLQICFVSKKPLNFFEVKKRFPRAHIEKVKDLTKSLNYVKKEGLYFGI